MIRNLIISFFFLTSVGFAQTEQKWFEVAQALKSENNSKKEQAIKWLKSEGSLNSQIISALDIDEYIEEAFLVSRVLKRGELYPNILKYADKKPSGRSISTLLEMSEYDYEKKFPTLINDLIGKRWKTIDAPSKVATLDSILSLGLILPIDKINSLLLENSDQLRILSIRIAGANLNINHESLYAEIIKKALSLSPYQLRVEALYAIEDLDDKKIKKQFTKTLELCMSDKNEIVKGLCTKLNESEVK